MAEKPERKTWDTAEWTEKAKQKDNEERDRMKEKDDALKKGKKPKRYHPAQDAPKPTELMKQREADLELEKNLNKTMVVNSTRGAGQPGFFCEVCNRNHKDSNSYLDHVNSRSHLKMLGQTTRIERSTVEQVRARIAELREQTKEVQTAKNFDFDKRLATIQENEAKIRAERAAKRKAAKEAQRIEMAKSSIEAESSDMAQMMGFTGFSTKK